MPSHCYLCGQLSELRPYGPRGEMVCFPCAMKPENKAATEQQFTTQLNAAGHVAIIGEAVGPYPYPYTSKEPTRGS